MYLTEQTQKDDNVCMDAFHYLPLPSLRLIYTHDNNLIKYDIVAYYLF